MLIEHTESVGRTVQCSELISDQRRASLASRSSTLTDSILCERIVRTVTTHSEEKH